MLGTRWFDVLSAGKAILGVTLLLLYLRLATSSALGTAFILLILDT